MSFKAPNSNAKTAGLVVGAVALTCAVGYAGYRVYSAQAEVPKPAEKTSKKKKAKRAKGSAPAPEATESTSETPAEPTPETKPAPEAKSAASSALPSAEDIAKLTPKERSTLAADLKASGNKLFQQKKYTEAIEYYTKCIELDEQAVYYSNRAACYSNLQNPEQVVADCTKALELDKEYVKALSRRASAYESQGTIQSLEKALNDFTAAAILNKFTNTETQTAVERVMASLSSKHAVELLATRQPQMPSRTFVKSYLDAFYMAKPDVKAWQEAGVEAKTGDATLQLAFDALAAQDYIHASTLASESVSLGLSTPRIEAEAYGLRGTFRFIMGDCAGALEDLDKATTLFPNNTIFWIKKASMHMELQKPADALADFERAMAIDDKDINVFYHRGQVQFINNQYAEAIQDYRRAIELDTDGSFIFPHIQLAVAEYKSGSTEKALHRAKQLCEKMPNSPEAFQYYGELLMDQNQFESAVKQFEKAIALDKARLAETGQARNPLLLVNMALATFQWKKDFAASEALCKEALEMDPQNDVTCGTLAQIMLQQNKVQEAIGYFHSSAELSRSQPELINALSYEYAAKAQLSFITVYPDFAKQFGLD